MLRMADGWAKAGRRVTLVIGDSGGALAHEIPDGVAVHELGSTAYRALFALPGIVRELSPDIIFCPGNHYTGAAFWLRRRLGRACPPIVGKVSNALVRPDLRRGASSPRRGCGARRRSRPFLPTTGRPSDASHRVAGRCPRHTVE